MKLTYQHNDMVIGGDFTENNIEIGDPRIIINHLVKSVYSNPKSTMVQEIASNARDANIEAGNSHIPIRIICPNTFEPNLIISDNGIGINPKRMHDIFIKIGNSTKRNENFSDGAFGIGSKIPLAYCDKFTVKTITQENDCLIRRMYAVVRQDDFSLKLIQLGQEHIVNSLDPIHDQHTGTEITIPIKKDDFSEIKDCIINKTQYWKVKPELINVDAENIIYNEIVLENSDFVLVKLKNHEHSYISNVHILLNDIPYTIHDAFDSDFTNNHEFSICNRYNYRIFLKFKIGEITPALNRESIQVNDEVKEKIKNKLILADKFIKNYYTSLIKQKPTFFDAIDAYTEIRNFIGFVINYRKNDDLENKSYNTCIETHTDSAGNTFHIHENNKYRLYFINNDKLKLQNPLTLYCLCDIDKDLAIFNTKKNKPLQGRIIYDYMKKHNLKYFLTFIDDYATKFFTTNGIPELIPYVQNLDDLHVKLPPLPKKPRELKKVHIYKFTSGNSSLDIDYSLTPQAIKDNYYFIYDKSLSSCYSTLNGNKITFDRDTVNDFRKESGVSVYAVTPSNEKYLIEVGCKPFSELLHSHHMKIICVSEIKDNFRHIDLFNSFNKTKFNDPLINEIKDLMSELKAIPTKSSHSYKRKYIIEKFYENLPDEFKQLTEKYMIENFYVPLCKKYPLLSSIHIGYNNIKDIHEYIHLKYDACYSKNSN